MAFNQPLQKDGVQLLPDSLLELQLGLAFKYPLIWYGKVNPDSDRELVKLLPEGLQTLRVHEDMFHYNQPLKLSSRHHVLPSSLQAQYSGTGKKNMMLPADQQEHPSTPSEESRRPKRQRTSPDDPNFTTLVLVSRIGIHRNEITRLYKVPWSLVNGTIAADVIRYENSFARVDVSNLGIT